MTSGFLQKLCLVVIVSCVVAPPLAADWPQWRGPNRDARVADASVPATWPKTLKEQWKVKVGVGHATPVVVGDKIFVFARQGEEEVLMALDSSTGKELWRTSEPIAYTMHPAATGHGKGPKATPVVSKGRVYTFGISGVLASHDAATGKLKWRKEFSKEYPATSPWFGVAMSPVIDNGVLFAHVGGQDKGALTAFDAETGNIKWSNNLDGPAYSSPVVVTLAGVRQVINFTQKDLVGVDAATGKLLWKLPAKSEYEENSPTVAIYKDMLIISREGKGLGSFRLAKEGSEIVPQEVWNNKDGQLYLNSPVVQGNLVFGMTPAKKGQFFAIDADTGKTVWQSPGRMGENAAILNLAGKVILFLTNEGKMIIQPAAATEYAPLVEYSVADSPTWAHPVVIGNRILVKDLESLTSFTIS
ncbi:MAG TPA: PQQ-binding-like beta-propeller repeat protein [Pyrinomonadaceae bacterium]|nr:PQQ-binding-like beta-propeller repeat protein [Pyrinomonadaceae bacterium]